MADRQLTQEEIDANVARALAEAESFKARAAESLAAAHQYEESIITEKLTQKQLKFLTEHSRIESEVALVALAKVQREEKFAKVNDVFHQVYTFDDAVSERSVKQCINTLTAWSRADPGCEITIYLNSPGGDIVEGFALIDFLLELRRHGHKITTIALGMAASMGMVILQAGDVRAMGKHATLLLHEGSLGVIGSWGEVEDRVLLMSKLQTRIFELISSRAVPLNPKSTVSFLRKLAKRHDVWLDAEESLQLGIIDEVR